MRSAKHELQDKETPLYRMGLLFFSFFFFLFGVGLNEMHLL